MRKIIVLLLLLSALGITTSAVGQSLPGDWVGQLNGSFKVRIHFERTGSHFIGTLSNPSGNETVLGQITVDGARLHFAVTKLNLSYDGVWSDEEKGWKGTLTFQQVYPHVLKRATAEEMAPAVHKRPQEDAITAGPTPYVERQVTFHNFAAHNELAGTLSLPSGEGTFPAVVLVSGTGRNTRDEDVWGHKVFLVLADALNRKGFAVELPGMNHLLQDAKTGAPSEYNDIEETMWPAALKLITDWLSRNVLAGRRETGLQSWAGVTRSLGAVPEAPRRPSLRKADSVFTRLSSHRRRKAPRSARPWNLSWPSSFKIMRRRQRHSH